MDIEDTRSLNGYKVIGGDVSRGDRGDDPLLGALVLITSAVTFLGRRRGGCEVTDVFRTHV